MPIIRKVKMTAKFFCVLICAFSLVISFNVGKQQNKSTGEWNIISKAQAQENSVDETLLSLKEKGEEYLSRGDIDNACKTMLEAYEKATDEKSNITAAVCNELSKALLEVGEAVYKRDGADKAEDWLDRSIEMNENNDQSHLMMGRIHFDRKDFDKSISAIKMANDINLRANNYILLAFTYLNAKFCQKAIETCNEGLNKNPTAMEASALLNIRGLANDLMGNQDQAKEDYQDAMKKDPGNEAAKNNFENLTSFLNKTQY